jgi:pimeloyl-ACP methyl ester carboxylesterase
VFFAGGVHAFFGLDLSGNDVSPAYAQYLVECCHRATARAGIALRELVAGLDLAAELPKLDLPVLVVLVVHGTHDVSAPVDLTDRCTAEFVPDGTLEVYENAGHGLFVAHAEQLTADIGEFGAGAHPKRKVR